MIATWWVQDTLVEAMRAAFGGDRIVPDVTVRPDEVLVLEHAVTVRVTPPRRRRARRKAITIAASVERAPVMRVEGDALVIERPPLAAPAAAGLPPGWRVVGRRIVDAEDVARAVFVNGQWVDPFGGTFTAEETASFDAAVCAAVTSPDVDDPITRNTTTAAPAAEEETRP